MNLSYNISGNLKKYLEKSEKLKVDILTYPLSPKNELRLKWGAALNRITWGLSLNQTTISKQDAAKILSSSFSPQKRLTKEQADVLAYRRTMDYLKDSWLVSPNSVSVTTIKKLYELSCKPSMGKMSGFTEYSKKRIDALLTYKKDRIPHSFRQALFKAKSSI